MPLKIEIFDKPEPEKPATLILNTRVTGDGAYEVFACDRSGKALSCGTLWTLHSNGGQIRWSGISRCLGLNLDDASRIRDA